MKTYSIRIVSYSSIDIEAESKEEAVKLASKHLSEMEATEYLNLADNGGGWEVDDEDEDEDEDGEDEVLPFHS